MAKKGTPERAELDALYALLEDVAMPLPDVTHRRMFGCDALFAVGNIFALIWQDARIGVRLPDPALYHTALDRPGAIPWAVDVGAKPMAHWVLLPESDHEDLNSLRRWIVRAHTMAMVAGPKAEKVKKKRLPKAARPEGP